MVRRHERAGLNALGFLLGPGEFFPLAPWSTLCTFGQNLPPSNMPTVCAMCFDCGFSTFTLAQNELLGLKEACTKAGAIERN